MQSVRAVSQTANTLCIELDNADGSIEAWLPDEADNRLHGKVALEFDDNVGLPAILKLLNRNAFRSNDYYEPEVEYLQRKEFVVSGLTADGAPSVARDLSSQIGGKLFEALISTEQMRRIFENVYRSRDSMHVQLSFRAESPVIGVLPWELLYQDQDFLFGGGRGTLSRHLAYSQLGYPRPPIDVSKLRVLLIAPRPQGVAELGWAEPEALLAVPELAVDVLKPATLDGLRTYLMKHRGPEAHHVIHFDGHGVYGRQCIKCGRVTPRVFDVCRTPGCEGTMLDLPVQGYLAVESRDGGIEFVSAQSLANLVGLVAREEGSALRLVVISACRSAAATGGSAFSGIAQRLIKARVPAVVAMQLEIRADTAAKFSQAMYTCLAQNDTLPTALGWARTLLDGMDDDQWYRPVLYLGATDNREGRFFNFGASDVVVLPSVAPPISEAIQLEPFESANDVVEPTRQGLSRLKDLAGRQPELVNALRPYVSAFQDIAQQLQLLGDYKGLHDELHELYYDCYAPARDQLASLDESPSVVLGFIGYERNIESRLNNLNDLKEAASGRVDGDALDWIGDLEEIDTDFKTSLDDRNRSGVATAIRRLGTLLVRRSAQINERIVSTASGVRAERLGTAMKLAAADQVVSAGVGSLDQLRVRLDALVGEHNRWQNLEPDLQELTRNLQSDLQAFIDDWPRIRKRLLELCEGHAELKVGKLRAGCSRVDLAMKDGVVDDVWKGTPEQLAELVKTYGACEFAAGQRFVRVDKDLKALCNDIERLHDPLVDVAVAVSGPLE